VETARHGLITEDFIRNTAPNQLSAEQGGFPVAFRDADIFVQMHKDAPEAVRDGTALILRTDRRLGFDPTAEWQLNIQASRKHGVFQPQVGSVTLSANYAADERFFKRPEVIKPDPAWLEALRNRSTDLIVLGIFLAGLLALLGFRLNRLAGHRHFTPIRLGILAVVIGFIGWWGQGQLSIVTPLGVIRTLVEGGSLAFLLYDPFSLAIWGVTIIGFVLWGRGLFCGWLCPFGAMQEFAHHAARLLGIRQITISDAWDERLKWVKYIALFALVATLFSAPAHLDTAIEVEPFKTAVTTYFIREWYYVAYAIGLLLLSMVVFKGFCRYVCPLGAMMAIGGLLRTRKWIDRRGECGSPCQLCKVKCAYGAIKKTGEIQYSECFQCLDCVTIHDDKDKCVPLILAARNGRSLHKVAAE
ncbi:MAG: 4Fe-4S binding protein, partial [Pikeienuella sp.]